MTDQEFDAQLRRLERERDTYLNKYVALQDECAAMRYRLESILAELHAKGIELDACVLLADLPVVARCAK